MRQLPVDWCEGMFLRPQHFQAADRHWAETVHVSEHFDHEYHYGLRRLSISEDALRNFQFQVVACEARLRDGTLVSLDLGQELDRVDMRPELERQQQTLKVNLAQRFETMPAVTVCLAVPKLKLGAVNVSEAVNAAPHRFNKVTQSIQDEVAGGNDQEIGFRALELRLLVLPGDNPAGYEYIPLAEVQRSGQQDPTPRLNAAYIPPLLAIDAWPELQIRIVQAIFDLIGNRMTVLGEIVRNRGLVVQERDDADRLFRLSALNEAYATLGVLAFAQGVHPFTAYTELCRIVGKLALLWPERSMPKPPAYDHDKLGHIFQWAYQRIRDCPEQDQPWEQRYFKNVGQLLSATLKPEWLTPAWRWYVGVNRALEVPENVVRELLSAGRLNWKLGSERQAPWMLLQGRPSLELRPCAQSPSLLPTRGWIYYEVGKEVESVAWRDVQESNTLAIKMVDELVISRVPDAQQIGVRYDRREVPLEFALFAVKEKR